MELIHFDELKDSCQALAAQYLLEGYRSLNVNDLLIRSKGACTNSKRIRQVGHQMKGSKVIANANSKKCKKPLTTLSINHSFQLSGIQNSCSIMIFLFLTFGLRQ
jgi:hypothetical protein